MKTKIKECIGVIYLTVNLLNGMGYVGYHFTSADDGYFGSGKDFKKIKKEIGNNNFRRIILDHYSTIKERKYKERYWIKILNMQNKNIGYNKHKGGGGFGENHPMWGKKGKDNPNWGRKGKRGKDSPNWGRKATPEEIEKMSLFQKGRKKSIEHKQKLSDALKGESNYMRGRKGKDNPNTGRKHTPEALDKISKGNTKYIYTFKSPEGKIVEMRSIAKFCKKNNLNFGSMYAIKRGKLKQHKGWTYISKKLINE